MNMIRGCLLPLTFIAPWVNVKLKYYLHVYILDKKKLEIGSVVRCAVTNVRGDGKIVTLSLKNKTILKSKVGVAKEFSN